MASPAHSRPLRPVSSIASRAALAGLLAIAVAMPPAAVVGQADPGEPARVSAVIDTLVTDLEIPTFVTHAGDGSGRLFVTEKPGRVRVIRAGGTLRARPLLDIADRTRTAHAEQGLLGLAFHPDFAENGRFYVDYTREPDGATVISEFRAEAGSASSDDERVLLVVPQPSAEHNGGMLAFDAEGGLVASLGDGGAGEGIGAGAQDPGSVLGKIIRLDVDTLEPYVPTSGDDGRMPEILAQGLRNPWRFSIDRELGHIYIGDVGLWSWEEIDVLPAGSGVLDFGWDTLEGPQCGPSAACDPAVYTSPSLAYAHAPHASIIGGYAYRGREQPLLEGMYVFGDFSHSRLFITPLDDLLEGSATPRRFGPGLVGGVLSLGEDEDGELLLTTASSVARIGAELVAGADGPAPPAPPGFPAIQPRSFTIDDLVIRPAEGALIEPGQPEIWYSNDVELDDSGICLAVEPSGGDPFLGLPLPDGQALRIETTAPGPMQIFLPLDGRVTEETSRTIDADVAAYELVLPSRPDGRASALRIDPPAGGTSIICLVALSA